MQYTNARSSSLFFCAFMLAAVLLTASNANAQIYIGGSVGSATIAVDIPDEDLGEVFEFDENDFAWKGFAGYNFELGPIDLAVEAGYVDLGAPVANLPGAEVALDVTGWDAFALVGFDIGPIGLFA